MARYLVILCATVALSLISGCGNKGPLYLPQNGADAPQAAVTEHDDNTDPLTQPE